MNRRGRLERVRAPPEADISEVKQSAGIWLGLLVMLGLRRRQDG